MVAMLFTASTVFSHRPMIAPSQASVNAISSISPIAASQPVMPASGRKPTSRPTPIVIVVVKIAIPMSARMRPNTTAERDIGNDANRSINPSLASIARPSPVFMPPNTSPCTMMPATR